MGQKPSSGVIEPLPCDPETATSTLQPPVEDTEDVSDAALAHRVTRAVLERPIWPETEPLRGTAATSRSTAEAELCTLAAAIQIAISTVAANAAAAAEQLDAQVAAAAERGACASDEAAILLAQVEEAATAKVSALEVEAVVVDAALEEAGGLRADAEALLQRIHAEGDGTPRFRDALLSIMSRAKALHVRLGDQLSCCPVELPDLSIVFSFPPADPLAPPFPLGTIVAPRGALISAEALEVRLSGSASQSHVWPGQQVTLEVALRATGAETPSAADLGVLVQALASRIFVRATLGGGPAGRPQTPLSVTCTPHAMSGCVRITATIPPEADTDSEFTLWTIRVAGRPLAHPPELPWILAVTRGLLPPFQTKPRDLTSGLVTPAISAAGVLYVPNAAGVSAYDALGNPLPGGSFSTADAGLAGDIRACAAFDSTLLIAQTYPGRIAAVDVNTRAVRWITNSARQSLSSCYGVAALPALGIVVATSTEGNAVHVLRLTDGENLSRTSPPTTVVTFAAADAATGTAFVTTGSFEVYPFRWDAGSLVALPPLGSEDRSSASRPITVIAGARTSYILVGAYGKNVVRVCWWLYC